MDNMGDMDQPGGPAELRSEPPTPLAAGAASGRHRTARNLGATQRSWLRVLPQIVSLLVVAAIVLGIVAVLHGAAQTGLHGTAPGMASKATGTPNGGSAQQMAPDFTLPTFNGTSFHLARQRGHVVILYFMSTTCAACVQGSYIVQAALQEAQVRSAQAVAIDMNLGDTAADVIAFARAAGIPAHSPLLWAFDAHQTVASSYGVLALSTVFVVDAQGRIVYESDGSVALGPLIQAVKSHA